jgi:hypothetical protein
MSARDAFVIVAFDISTFTKPNWPRWNVPHEGATHDCDEP